MSFRPLVPGTISPGFTHVADWWQADPIVEIEVAATDAVGIMLGEAQLATVMIDSGAEYTILDERLAPLLGLDLAALPEADMFGIGNQKVLGRAHYNTLIGLCGVWVSATVVFQSRPNPQLLGREGVFSRLSFAFLGPQQRLLAAA